LHFLCMTGYLTYRDIGMGEVWIPNREMYNELVTVVKQLSVHRQKRQYN
jgi:hypothetical protein